jgi:hypothetical protein
LASTSPHERILERFRAEHADEEESASDTEAGEFSQLSRRHTGTSSSTTDSSATKLPVPVYRSASMSDLADNGNASSGGQSTVATANNSGHRASGGDMSLQRAASVEGSLNNKENFAVPRDPSPPSAPTATTSGSGGKKGKSGGQRKILNAQNSKS